MVSDERNGQRRHEILQAAGAVFIEMGFQGATTADIAKRAKTSKRTLYALFGSKDGMLAALIAETTDAMIAPIDLPAPASVEAFTAILQGFAGHFLDQLLDANRIAIQRIVIAESATQPELGRVLERHGRLTALEGVLKFFERGAQAGFIAADDIRPAISAFFGVLMAPLQMQLLLAQQVWPDEKVKQERVALAIRVLGKFLIKAPVRVEGR